MRRFEAIEGKLVTLPTRKTIGSAGYDFRCPYSYTFIFVQVWESNIN